MLYYHPQGKTSLGLKKTAGRRIPLSDRNRPHGLNKCLEEGENNLHNGPAFLSSKGSLWKCCLIWENSVILYI